MRVAIIPARGGSKRIPRKNIRSFHGMPIMCHSIARALESELFDGGVFVSTEDPEIAAIASGFSSWVRILDRNPLLADDRVGTQDVMQNALRTIMPRARQGDYACCIYPTAPMMTARDLLAGFKALTSTEWHPSYAFSVTNYDFHPSRAIRLGAEGGVWPVSHESMEKPSQELELLWHDAGQWYWGRASAFLRNERLYGPASIGVPISRARAQDIDTEEDWRMAEILYAALCAQTI